MLKEPVAAFDPTKVGVDLQHEIEQFYYREAALLDRREFKAWLSLLAEDLRYFMPLRMSRMNRFDDKEFSDDNEYASFDEDIVAMRGRIRKVLTDFSWSENPYSKTRHLVSNVIVEPLDDEPGTYKVHSAFVTYRNRAERQVDIWTGERRDVIRRAANPYGFEISKRTILIDQSTLLANNLSIFF
ncbi:aromatic-ring-hydroxylating dioxygenase subunit beta [Sphingomonas sp. MG17]|uniref:Aromatic-ring-hydroxylating dioxygenase subunit beta n=1 Tax=Sphingomonas tagetis TaxID=2949092 RepID=A0A9X2KP15_9SPHN|nr:aromatic-ring-hydroxylating dioxygenase subunit beta [Sphingomonas tagetis]MCP3733136.1 aromatic-ring-hydroxylating dioxygenase subunit beta [Sphingomonas tagetis]